jgi:hypothetical protein
MGPLPHAQLWKACKMLGILRLCSVASAVMFAGGRWEVVSEQLCEQRVTEILAAAVRCHRMKSSAHEPEMTASASASGAFGPSLRSARCRARRAVAAAARLHATSNKSYKSDRYN